MDYVIENVVGTSDDFISACINTCQVIQGPNSLMSHFKAAVHESLVKNIKKITMIDIVNCGLIVTQGKHLRNYLDAVLVRFRVVCQQLFKDHVLRIF